MIVIRTLLAASTLACFAPAAQQSFVEVGAARGLGAYVQASGMSAGAAAEDFDGDGDIDVFVPTACGQPDSCFATAGTGTSKKSPHATAWRVRPNHRAALWFDADSDGDLDLVVGGDEFDKLECGGPSSLLLYVQQADGRFAERTREAGLARYLSVAPDSHLGGMAAGDLDLDGDLDLIVTFWEGYTHVYRNDGSGRFEDQAAQLGLQEWRAHWQPVIHDFNGDGWPDVFQAVDFQPNALWINQAAAPL